MIVVLLRARGWQAVGAALAVALVVGEGGCGRRPAGPGPTPEATPAPSESTSQAGLSAASVVMVGQLPGGRRWLVCYDLASEQTRGLVVLGRDDHPTVDPAGAVVMVQTWTGPMIEAFAAHVPVAGTGSHLESIDLATGARPALTPTSAEVFDTRPVGNRAGDGWVYFVRAGAAATGAGAGLMRVDPGTGDVQAVPHRSGVTRSPWSPAGRPPGCGPAGATSTGAVGPGGWTWPQGGSRSTVVNAGERPTHGAVLPGTDGETGSRSGDGGDERVLVVRGVRADQDLPGHPGPPSGCQRVPHEAHCPMG